MGFRQKYKKETGLRFPDSVHVHHIDCNHKNNKITNLVNIPRLTHLRYHYIINRVRDIIVSLRINGYTTDDLRNNSWLRSTAASTNIGNNWTSKIIKYEKLILKNINIRNDKLNIVYENTIITDQEREIIIIYSKK